MSHLVHLKWSREDAKDKPGPFREDETNHQMVAHLLEE